MSSACAAAAVAFLLGRLFRPRLRRWLEKRDALQRNFAFVDRTLADAGFRAMLLLRLIPAPPIVNYLYGCTRVGFPAYMCGTAIGYLPGTAAAVYSGAAGRSSLLGGAPLQKKGLLSQRPSTPTFERLFSSSSSPASRPGSAASSTAGSASTLLFSCPRNAEAMLAVQPATSAPTVKSSSWLGLG